MGSCYNLCTLVWGWEQVPLDQGPLAGSQLPPNWAYAGKSKSESMKLQLVKNDRYTLIIINICIVVMEQG